MSAPEIARIVYVGCDPVTLTRDLNSAVRDLRVTANRAFHMFPQTAHVETVVRLGLSKG